MNKNLPLALVALLALAGCSETAAPTAEPVTLAPATQATAAVNVIVESGVSLENAANLNEESVTYTWKLEEGREIAEAPRPHVDISREYRVYVNGEQLAQGVELPLTQAGALIAITPLTPSPIVARADALEAISLGNAGSRLTGSAGIDALADGAQVAEVGDLMANPNMLAFTTSEAAGTGDISMRIAGADPDSLAMIQVVERRSPFSLRFSVDKGSYFVGDSLHFDAQWSEGMSSVHVNWARLRTPDGSITPVEVTDGGQPHFRGSASIPNLQLRPGELVELEVDSVGLSSAGQQVHRTAKTAFAISRRTAALTQATRLETSTDGVNVPVEVEVGSRGRYAVTGILYGTDAGGTKRAFLGCQTAQMLDPGTRSLSLHFSPENLALAPNLSAPYEIRDLRLQDQSRMYTLE